MNKWTAIVCQLLGALIGAYGASSIMSDGVGWGSVFLGVVLIFFGSKAYLQASGRSSKEEGEKGDKR